MLDHRFIPRNAKRGDPIAQVCCPGFLREPPHVRSPNSRSGVGEGRAPGVSVRCSPPACPRRGQGLPREKSLLGLLLRIRAVSSFPQV